MSAIDVPALSVRHYVARQSVDTGTALSLAQALQACLSHGAHDAAVALGGAKKELASVPGGPTGIPDFFDLGLDDQRRALRSIVAQECRAIFSAFVANGESTTHA